MFHLAGLDAIRRGEVTDVYFRRTLRILEARGIDRRVRAEFVAKSLPGEWPWAVLAGLEEAAALLEGLEVDVRAMPEGSLFRPMEPVMEIAGPYRVFAALETALLGLLCQASGIATRAARYKLQAGDRPVFSFGARRMHPVLAPMVERNAYVGGCDGVAVVRSAELLGLEPVGTIPHALVLLMGDTVEALRAFDEVIEPGVRRVALIDTFGDEKFEAVRVAEALGDRLYAVRLDTPASRRGDFARILEEVRWELDLRGHRAVRIIASGGIREEELERLNPWVDAYGVGTAISNAPVVDFSMDIVEVDGRPLAKRGKPSGAKAVLRCSACGSRAVVPLDQADTPCPHCSARREPLLRPWMRRGRLLAPHPSPHDLRSRVLRALGEGPPS